MLPLLAELIGLEGNLLLLALDAIDPVQFSSTLEINVATSIGAFILGAVFFGHIGRLLGQRRRLLLIVSNLVQTCLVFAATAIQLRDPSGVVGSHAAVKMSLLGFAMAGQVSSAVGVGLAELNTTMVTASLIQLCFDPAIFKLNNPSRTRRVAFVLVMAAGHFVGAAASKYRIALGMLLPAIVKAVVMLSFCINHGVVKRPRSDAEAGGSRDAASTDGTTTPVWQTLWGD